MRILLAFLYISIVLGSCKETVDVKPSDLRGKWNFSKAFRNGKESKTLKNAYFEFQDDKSIISNLFQKQENTTFTVENSKLVIHDAEPLELEIKEFYKDSMYLTGRMNSFDMEFHLIKENP